MSKEIERLLGDMAKASIRRPYIIEIGEKIGKIVKEGTPAEKKGLKECLERALGKYQKTSMQHFCQDFLADFIESCPVIGTFAAKGEDQAIKDVTFASNGEIYISIYSAGDVRNLMQEKIYPASTKKEGFTYEDLSLNQEQPENMIIIGGEGAVDVVKEIAELRKSDYMSVELAKNIKEFLSVGKKEEAGVSLAQQQELAPTGEPPVEGEEPRRNSNEKEAVKLLGQEAAKVAPALVY